MTVRFLLVLPLNPKSHQLQYLEGAGSILLSIGKELTTNPHFQLQIVGHALISIYANIEELKIHPISAATTIGVNIEITINEINNYNPKSA